MSDETLTGTWVEEIPPTKKRQGKWAPVIEELQEARKNGDNKWKMFEVSNASSIAQHLKSRYGVETTTRDDTELYIRWPKPAPKSRGKK